MAKEVVQIIAVGGLGAIVAYLAGAGRKNGPQGGEAVWMATYAPEQEQKRSTGIGSLVSGLLSSALKGSGGGGGVNPPSASTSPLTTARTTGVGSLLDVIGKGEGGAKGYDAYYGGIKDAHAPPRPPTQMTVGEVLDWQDSIDPIYRSEAVGKYQFMEDTLRDLVARGVVSTGTRFNGATQDKLATALLQRRGLAKYQAGEISAETFGNNIAKEWAGAPVVSEGKTYGRSYYDGFNGNSATISVDSIMNAIRRI